VNALKTLLALSAALLSLSGCVTLKGEHSKASQALIGKPVSYVEARYGRPLAVGDGELEFDAGRGVGVISGLHTSTINGYVGNTPFTGTATTPVVYGTYDTYCRLRVSLDSERVITGVGLSGYADQCHKSLKALY
jgi:hypothetical protein